MAFALLAMLCIAGTDASGQSRVRRKCGIVRPTPDRVGTFTAGRLAGRVLGDLYTGYIGIRGRVPERVQVDPGRQLDSLWRAKLACQERNPVAVKLYEELLGEYRERRSHITIEEFIKIAEAEISLVRSNMNWQELGRLYRLAPVKLEVVRLLAFQITGRDFLAYGLTEIMPSKDGGLNVRVLEFLVRNFGPEFVYAIPARHDRFASFGFYQFTSRALRDDGKVLEGASKASHALRRGRLPRSTVLLRGDIQHRGAYLFAIHNIATLVRQLNGTQLARLRNLPRGKHVDLIEFIAAAHNGPAYAYSAARRWLDNHMRLPYYVSVGNRNVRNYAEKTLWNHLAIHGARAQDGTLFGQK